MLVGMTYDLKDDYLAKGYTAEETAEFDSAETIQGIEDALLQLGYDTERIGNVHSLVENLAAGKRWDVVFNIAEGIHGIAREAQAPAILDAYTIPYTFSDPAVLSLTLHKGHAKSVVNNHGISTPCFKVINNIEDLSGVEMAFPLFVKPVAEGTSKGVGADSLVKNREQLLSVCASLMERFNQPVLVETYLPGREFTVGIVGAGGRARVIGSMEVCLTGSADSNFYSYSNKVQWEGRVDYRPADDSIARKAEALALSAWCVLGCRDGGRVDVRCDSDGEPNFIEVNPLAGLNPVISDLPIICRMNGVEYVQLIGMIMESAKERVSKRALPPAVHPAPLLGRIPRISLLDRITV